jgi:NTE family protein
MKKRNSELEITKDRWLLAIEKDSVSDFVACFAADPLLARLTRYEEGAEQKEDHNYLDGVSLEALFQSISNIATHLPGPRGIPEATENELNLLQNLAKQGAVNIFSAIVRFAIDIDINNHNKSFVPVDLFLAIGMQEAFKCAIENGKHPILSLLDYIDWNDEKKIVLLLHAVRQKKPESVRVMMRRLSRIIDDYNYHEVLREAIIEHDYLVLRELLDPNVLQRPLRGCNPLVMLANSGKDYSLLIDYLFPQYYCDEVDEGGNTPLHRAILAGNANIVRKLAPLTNLNIIESGKKKPFESAVVSYCAARENRQISQDELCDRIEIIKLLAQAGADVNSCLEKAKGDERLQQLLFRLGANIAAPPKIIVDNHGENLIIEDYPVWLAFKGGGVKGLGYLGAILEAIAHSLIKLEKVEGFIGTSAGAITALLLALRIPLERLRQIMEKMDFTLFLDYHDIKAFKDIMKEIQGGNDIWKVLVKNGFTLLKIKTILDKHLGACKGEAFLKWLYELIAEAIKGTSLASKSPDIITFRDLHDHPDFADLVVYSSNISTGRPVRRCFGTDPDMPIADAVRESMGLPIIFQPHRKYIVINNKRVLDDTDTSLYVDGGLYVNYPIKDRDYNSVTGEYTRYKKILGFCLVSDDEQQEYEHRVVPKVNDISVDGVLSFVLKMITSAMFNVQDQDVMNGLDLDRTIFIRTRDVGTTELTLSESRREMLYSEGREGVRNFLRRRRMLSDKEISDYLRIQLCSLGLLTNEGLVRWGGNKPITPAKIFKLYARAREEELDFLRTIVNPNWCDKNGLTAYHIARHFGYKDVEMRLLKCNANPHVEAIDPELIRRAIAVNSIIHSRDISGLKLPGKQRVEAKKDAIINQKDQEIRGLQEQLPDPEGRFAALHACYEVDHQNLNGHDNGGM